MAPDGDVVTVYRNRRALRAISRKMKYRLPERDWQLQESDATHVGKPLLLPHDERAALFDHRSLVVVA
jgi:hypothetical protein